MVNELITKKDVTFVNSKDLPFQRWYPFIEGYSPNFVKYIIDNYQPNATLIYDPFAGTGTTIFAADDKKINSYYSEINPFLVFLIETKIKILKLNEEERLKLSKNIREVSKRIFQDVMPLKEDNDLKNNYSRLFGNSKYFDGDTLSKLLKLRTYIDNVKLEDDLLANTITLAILSCLIPISFLKKAGDLRFKTKKEIKKEKVEIEYILPKKLNEIAEDITNLIHKFDTNTELILFNSKKIGLIKDAIIDTIITSPPYLNGTNYFRNTKLELWFLRYIQYKQDLRLYRDQTLTSGINDVTITKNYKCNQILDRSPILKITFEELEDKAYDRRIPLMVKNYFEEMYMVFSGLRNHLTDNARIIIDIGDSMFAGVHVKTDKILAEILISFGYGLLDEKTLRKRRSRNKSILSQVLLVFDYKKGSNKINQRRNIKFHWEDKWKDFKINLPHQKKPFSKRNWGHLNHSLCSYQGRIKASIAYHLVKTFVPEGGIVLDPFCGVGTIPFEASLNGRKSYGIDISLPAYYISSAKVSACNRSKCLELIEELSVFIKNNSIDEKEIQDAKKFGFNKVISDYYEKTTLKEILISRKFFENNPPRTPSQMLVISSLLHILHGNRPYALSRRSHPIVPYAPKGEFIYKNLIEKLTEKVEKNLREPLPEKFTEGRIFHLDSTEIWPQEITNLDAIITSPPFFDSTRFHLANWIRLWFCGWSNHDFKYRPNSFVEEKQKEDFDVYRNIFIQARERLKPGGVMVLHLGKSKKCDMAEQLIKVSKKWFDTVDLFDENVEHCESHGIRDKGTVTNHQYLILS